LAPPVKEQTPSNGLVRAKQISVLFALVLASSGVNIAAADSPVPAPHSAKEIWIGSTAAAFGRGQSATAPLDGSTRAKVDEILEDLRIEYGDYGAGVTIHFLPGRYEVGGIGIRPRWQLRGAGIDRTILKRVAAPRDFLLKNPILHVIEGGGGPQQKPPLSGPHLPERDYVGIHISGMTLDCNWDGLKASIGSPLKKAGGLSVVCKEGVIEKVKVINFGAQGGRPSWREVFPIHLRSSLTDNLGAPGYATSRLQIFGCEVVGPVRGPSTGIEWPYCTGIMIGHRETDPTLAEVTAIVRGNEIRDVTNGHAFGGAHLRQALFESNRVVNCGLGFNFDTGGSRNVTIRANDFVNCIGGGTLTDATSFIIQSNRFEIRYNATELPWWNTGVRLWSHTRQCTVSDNTFTLVPGYEPTPAAETFGIRVHGTNVGVLWTQSTSGDWSHSPQPHRIENNHIHADLPNQIGPQDIGNWLYAIVDGREVALSGQPGQAQGAVFSWRGSLSNP